MQPQAPPDYPEEFRVSTEAAQAADPLELASQLHDVWGLHALLVRRSAENYSAARKAEERHQADQKQLLALLQATAAILDETRRLVADAQRNLTAPESSGCWTKWFFVPPAPASSAPLEWLSAFGRLVDSASTRLEDHHLQYIPLVGKDLREVVLEDGQPAKRWVAAKNASATGSQVVVREICGLWVAHWGGKLVPAQRGEVLVS